MGRKMSQVAQWALRWIHADEVERLGRWEDYLKLNPTPAGFQFPSRVVYALAGNEQTPFQRFAVKMTICGRQLYLAQCSAKSENARHVAARLSDALAFYFQPWRKMSGDVYNFTEDLARKDCEENEYLRNWLVDLERLLVSSGTIPQREQAKQRVCARKEERQHMMTALRNLETQTQTVRSEIMRELAEIKREMALFHLVLQHLARILTADKGQGGR